MTKYLDVDCFLCEKPRLSKPNDSWVEVISLSPHRRAHISCFHEVLLQIRDINEDDPLAFLTMVEERERKRGIEPVPRDESWAY